MPPRVRMSIKHDMIELFLNETAQSFNCLHVDFYKDPKGGKDAKEEEKHDKTKKKEKDDKTATKKGR